MKYDTDPKVLERQVTVETYRSRGPGGQRKNKTETAVRLKHLPTGITVVATEYRSQTQNRKLAFQRLKERILRLSQPRRRRIPTSVPWTALEKRKEDAFGKETLEINALERAGGVIFPSRQFYFASCLTDQILS